MIRPFLVWIVCLTSVCPLLSQEDYWQQFVHYDIDVRLDPTARVLKGTETLLYRNVSPDTLTAFYMHLYPNAYRGAESIMAREAAHYYLDIVPDDPGFLRIDSFKILSGKSHTLGDSLPAFRVNDTLLEAELPAPLLPGEELTVELSFYLKIRSSFRRAGYRDEQFDFAQWYPKVCVYDETGWNAEPFHLQGEFYGEFGTFDVSIDVPYNYIVAATGVVVEGDPGWENVRVHPSEPGETQDQRLAQARSHLAAEAERGKRRTVTFHAEKVHDFAWVTCPDFLYERSEWDTIPIHVFYRSYAKERWSRIVGERSARALEWLSEKFGRYPYPQLSITHGLLRGGMEYPMLVMNASEREGLILHEVGHIYFFGILANNEWKEAWLDEGFTSFQTRWYMETRYGAWGYDREAELRKAGWLQRHRPVNTRREISRTVALDYMNSGHNEPISKVAHEFREPAAYGVNAYTKGAFFFDMLRYVVGDSAFSVICQTYFKRWAFKHVNEDRFRQVCEEVSGQELDWFFQQWLHDSLTVDYNLGEVKKRNVEGVWKTEVSVIRKGQGRMPVDVELSTEDGQTLVKRWDGQEKVGVLSFETQAKPARVELDPEDAILNSSRLDQVGLRPEIQFEYPSMSYFPRDSYLITWRPSGWYNDVDKLRIGGRFKGSYGASRNAYIGIWYGVDSRQLDFRLAYANPIKPLGSLTRGALILQKMEGRFEVDAHLSFVISKLLATPPRHEIKVGFNHTHRLDLDGKGERYTLRDYDQGDILTVQTWESGNVNKLYASYTVNPRAMKWYSRFQFGLEAVLNDLDSDFSYGTVYGELKFWAPKATEGMFLRLFAQTIFDSDKVPIQEQINLDGANARTRFSYFYTRSHKALPAKLHFHLPGGGNMRGYYNQAIAGEQILAGNLELRKQLPGNFLGHFMGNILGDITVVGFADVASLGFLEPKGRLYADAGAGVRFQNFLPDQWYTILTHSRDLMLRFDFPIWVSDPVPGENPLRFRWIVGVEQAF